ncbi:MAG: DUF2232 domain-containing protein [Clostridiales bacterium]|nr:DUF2232 domain-containing protein [Clostridiales bacterium]
MDFLQPILSTIFLLLPIILIAGLIKRLGKKVSFYEYILLSAGSVLFSLVLYLITYRWINSQSAFDAIWSSFRQSFTSGIVDANQLLSLYHQWGIFQNFTTAEQLVDFFISEMKNAVPAVIVLSSLIYGVALFLIIRLILKLFDYQTSAVRRFEEWNLPKGMAMGLVILMLVSLMGQNLGIPRFEIVNFTITALISFLFMIMGLSMLWFFLKAGNVPAAVRWVLIILILLILGTILPFLGLIDQLFHLRVRYRNKFLFKNGK